MMLCQHREHWLKGRAEYSWPPTLTCLVLILCVKEIFLTCFQTNQPYWGVKESPNKTIGSLMIRSGIYLNLPECVASYHDYWRLDAKEHCKKKDAKYKRPPCTTCFCQPIFFLHFENWATLIWRKLYVAVPVYGCSLEAPRSKQRSQDMFQ
jgi:hypothetical protein